MKTEILNIKEIGGNYHVTIIENGEVIEDIVTPHDLRDVVLTNIDREYENDSIEHIMDRVEENIEYYINAYYAEGSVA